MNIPESIPKQYDPKPNWRCVSCEQAGHRHCSEFDICGGMEAPKEPLRLWTCPICGGKTSDEYITCDFCGENSILKEIK